MVENCTNEPDMCLGVKNGIIYCKAIAECIRHGSKGIGYKDDYLIGMTQINDPEQIEFCRGSFSECPIYLNSSFR